MLKDQEIKCAVIQYYQFDTNSSKMLSICTNNGWYIPSIQILVPTFYPNLYTCIATDKKNVKTISVTHLIHSNTWRGLDLHNTWFFFRLFKKVIYRYDNTRIISTTAYFIFTWFGTWLENIKMTSHGFFLLTQFQFNW